MDHPLSALHCQLQLRNGKRLFQLEIDLPLQQGELLALSGASGSGKTTVLRILAGLERRAKGQVIIQGEVWQDSSKGVFVPPQRRSIGVVFQDYALFPNLSVRGNLQFANHRQAATPIVEELLDVMDLRDLQWAFPRELSGGQQQRVALARALVRRPKLLLLDEPLSALDADLRTRLQGYIQEIHHRYQLCTVLVSHHVEEIQRLAQRVVYLSNGRVVAEQSQHTTPANTWVLRAQWQGVFDGHLHVQLGDNLLKTPLDPGLNVAHLHPGQEVWVRLQADGQFSLVDPS